ncbi:hypothetical protein V8D89_008628 [Ganoderma adspersum]
MNTLSIWPEVHFIEPTPSVQRDTYAQSRQSPSTSPNTLTHERQFSADRPEITKSMKNAPVSPYADHNETVVHTRGYSPSLSRGSGRLEHDLLGEHMENKVSKQVYQGFDGIDRSGHEREYFEPERLRGLFLSRDVLSSALVKLKIMRYEGPNIYLDTPRPRQYAEERPHCRVFSRAVMPMLQDIATGVITSPPWPENACVARDDHKAETRIPNQSPGASKLHRTSLNHIYSTSPALPRPSNPMGDNATSGKLLAVRLFMGLSTLESIVSATSAGLASMQSTR